MTSVSLVCPTPYKRRQNCKSSKILKIGDKVTWIGNTGPICGLKKYEGTIVAIVPAGSCVDDFIPNGMRFRSYHPCRRSFLSFLIKRGGNKIINWPRTRHIHPIEKFTGLI